MSPRDANSLTVLVIFGLLSLVILGFAAYNLYVDEQFDHDALKSQATIKQGSITRGSKSSIHYRVVYVFRDLYFRRWTATTDVARETYARLHVNDAVPVKYLDDGTNQSRIDWPSEDEYHWKRDEALFGIGLFVAGFAVLVYIVKRPRRTWITYYDRHRS